MGWTIRSKENDNNKKIPIQSMIMATKLQYNTIDICVAQMN